MLTNAEGVTGPRSECECVKNGVREEISLRDVSVS